MRTSPVSEDMAEGIDNCINVLINNITILLLLCLVCHIMGACYVKLSQLDAAEKALSQSLQLKTYLYSPGHDAISNSETFNIDTEGMCWSRSLCLVDLQLKGYCTSCGN